MSICESCGVNHDGSFGSGRFCSRGCANRRNHSNETKDKIRNALEGRPLSENHPIIKNGGNAFTYEQRKIGGINGSRAKSKKYRQKRRELYESSWCDFCKRYPRYIKTFVIEERGYKCECCGIFQWNDKRIVIELHHIDGDKNNNDKDNLQLLCPNCHSQTENWKSKNKILVDTSISV